MAGWRLVLVRCAPCYSLWLNILNMASSPWEHLMRPRAYPLRKCNFHTLISLLSAAVQKAFCLWAQSCFRGVRPQSLFGYITAVSWARQQVAGDPKVSKEGWICSLDVFCLCFSQLYQWSYKKSQKQTVGRCSQDRWGFVETGCFQGLDSLSQLSQSKIEAWKSDPIASTFFF